MSPLLLVVAGLLMVIASWALYWPKIKAIRVPLHPWGHQLTMVLGIGLAIAAAYARPDWIVLSLSVLTTLAGAFFLFVTLISGLPSKTPAVQPGDPFLDFTLPNTRGRDFTLASLEGTPFLLHFYRGHW